MSHVQMLPLKALQPSPLNARRMDKKIAIDELAASIQAHGLLQRVAMHPLDEVEAFGRLADEGQTEDAIAARFGASVRHVRQRLALAALSPTLKDALRKGELGLDAARAFCLVADHERQDAVFAIMTKPVSNAYAVRSYLTQGAVRVTDRLAKFVGGHSQA